MRVWLLARRFDVSRWENGGKSKGSGIGKFSLKAAGLILKLSPVTIRTLLRDAKLSGLIRNYKQKGDWVTVYCSSLERAIAIAGLDKVGPFAAINIDDLRNLHIIATEVEAQNLQRSSFYLQRREEIAQIKLGECSSLRTPVQLMTPTLDAPCDKLGRVLGRSQRFIFCESGFKFYGGSQEALAQLRGLSPGTISRHLSNNYRLAASPLHKFREDLPPISKKQLLERLPHLQNMPAKLCHEEGLILLSGDWYKPHTNIYLLNHRLVSARRRRASIHNQNLWFSKKLRGDLENKSCLSEVLREDSTEKENSPKNQDKEKQK